MGGTEIWLGLGSSVMTRVWSEVGHGIGLGTGEVDHVLGVKSRRMVRTGIRH